MSSIFQQQRRAPSPAVANLGLVRPTSASSVHRIPFRFSSLARRRHCAYAKFLRTNERPKKASLPRRFSASWLALARPLRHSQAVHARIPTGEIVIMCFRRRLASAVPEWGPSLAGEARDSLLTSHGRRQITLRPAAIPLWTNPLFDTFSAFWACMTKSDLRKSRVLLPRNLWIARSYHTPG
jgi:hypothetical protein